MKVNTKIIKATCFSLFCFLVGIAFWFLLKKFFLWQDGKIITNLIIASICFGFFFIFIMLYLVLTDSRKTVLLSSFFIAFSFLPFFLQKNGKWVRIPAIISFCILALLLFVFFNLTNKALIYDRKNSIKFHSGKSLLKSGPALLVIFAILFAVLFYFNFPLLNDEGNIEIKEKQIERLAEPFGQMINRFVPVPIYDLDMSADEFIVISAFISLPFIKEKEDEEIRPPIALEEPPEGIINYFKEKGIYDLEGVNFGDYMNDEEFRKLFFEELRKLTPTADPYLMNQYRQNLSKNWGIEIDGKDRMGEVYTKFINNKINEIPKKIRDLFLIFPSVILFGVLEICFLILNLIFSLIGWIVLIIFYKTHFYHFRKVEVEKEEIEL